MWSPVERACSPEAATVTGAMCPAGRVWALIPQTAYAVSNKRRFCNHKMNTSLTGPVSLPAGHSFTLTQIRPAERVTSHVQTAQVEVCRTALPVYFPVSFTKGSVSIYVPMASMFRIAHAKRVTHHVKSAQARPRQTVLPARLMPVSTTDTVEPAALRAST